MKNFPLWIGSILLAFFVFVMLAGPYMPFIDKDLKKEPSRWVMKDGKQKLTLPPYKPSSKNWLGSDKRGVDNLSKLVVTAKDTILLVLAITAVRYAIGVPLGLIARKKRGSPTGSSPLEPAVLLFAAGLRIRAAACASVLSLLPAADGLGHSDSG